MCRVAHELRWLLELHALHVKKPASKLKISRAGQQKRGPEQEISQLSKPPRTRSRGLGASLDHFRRQDRWPRSQFYNLSNSEPFVDFEWVDRQTPTFCSHRILPSFLHCLPKFFQQSRDMLRHGCGSKPFWYHFGVGEFTTNFLEWDVHWGYDLALTHENPVPVVNIKMGANGCSSKMEP